MRIFAVCFSALVISVSLSVGTASADCQADCWAAYQDCFQSCSQCQCSQDLDSCVSYCQYADSDGDGVVDPSDNCSDVSNANQADCDNDGRGNVCDSQDNSWILIAVGNSKCAVDEGSKIRGKEIRISYRDTYRSACTGATCYKKVGQATHMCTWGSESQDLYHCCRQKQCNLSPFYDLIPCPDCDGAWGDHCGQPRCPF